MYIVVCAAYRPDRDLPERKSPRLRICIYGVATKRAEKIMHEIGVCE